MKTIQKKALFNSILSLIICLVMLVGTTFAWFTDSVTSGVNRILAGNLDIELEYRADDGSWKTVNESTEIFDKDALWEPGHTEVVYLRVSNLGSLALKYQLGVNIVSEVGSVNVNGDPFLLSDYIRFGALEGVETPYADRSAARKEVTASRVISDGYTKQETMLKGEAPHYVALVVYMPEETGNEANYRTGETPPSIDLGIELVATQAASESDSFGNDYDTLALFPGMNGSVTASAPVTVENGKTTAPVTITADGGNVVATVPAGVAVKDGVSTLTLTIKPVDKSQANIMVGKNEVTQSVDVHIEGIADDNTVPVLVYVAKMLKSGLNMGNYAFYHVEDGTTNAMNLVAVPALHNDYSYAPATGDVTMALASFSEVAAVADTVNAWEGKFDYSWYSANTMAQSEDGANYIISNADQLAALGAIVGGMDGQTQDSFSDQTIQLVSDINIGDKESENNSDIIFYPIGYYNSEGTYERTNTAITSELRNFEGTFDGNGHKISNIYHNTWEMKGDHNWYSPEEQYYRDGMGIFGKVYGGTVKNLTVENFSSDGEIATTGVIAAYADGATFENIAIKNCNPRVYNIGNGGIVGCVGWYAKEAGLKTTFKNITVDNSNKISALWGSYDVACGGIVGQYYPTSGQTSAGTPKNEGIDFVNCHVSAVMDVYNDVCANYQYYAYRYAGMIIGSIRENTTNEEGKTIPDMTGISATACTVNYGDWNDYYYCEFEKNSIASYSEDYQFSRVPHSELKFTDSNGNGLVDADERPSVTGCKHTHTNSEDKQAVYLPFHQLFTGYGWGVNSIGLEKYSGIVTNLDITEGDNQESVEKFETKFTGNFLYRVGNQNTVALDSLFAVIDGASINDSGVWMTVEKVDENSNVSGTFTANTSDWKKGTIQFSGTGVVKVTIQDYNFCTPTILYLEVVDAVNTTTATSATKNNVVLLNDCGFSSLEVSGGYALYGNGFTMTCGSDSAALDMGYSFVTLNSGTLDNVQIVCPDFDYAALYKSNLTSSDNRSETTDKTRYYNAKSGVMASGNSQILNSRISGARAAVNVSGGNVVIDNSRVELGAVASILVGAANSLTLRDVTLIQNPTASTYDSSKTLMGFSVLYLCDSEGKATPTTLEGSFVQQAWVSADDKQYVPSAGQDIVDGVMKETAFIHNINGKDSLNLGFAYMPEDAQKTVAAPDNITDNRTDKATVPYEMKDVKIQISILSTTVYVYSYKNTNGTADSFKTESDYVPNKYSDIITVTYSDTADGLTTGKSFGTDGWVYELNVDLDKLSGYALDFSKLSMSVNGVSVTDFKVNGNAKPTSPVAVSAGGTTYTLTATVSGKEHTATYKVTGTETSKESPSLVASNYEAGLCVASSYGGTWSGAAPALQGIQIKYWSVAEKQYKTITLSDYTPTTEGKQNGTNTTWTYSPDNGDFTLTLTGGQVHSGNSVNAMPVVCDGKLYFVASSSKGLVNTGNSARTVPVSYTFEDNNNGDVLTFSHTWSVAENKDGQYNYSDFCNGTLTKLEAFSGGENCLAAGTLMTLSDGSKREIENLRKGDLMMSFDHLTGEVVSKEVIIVVRTRSDFYENTFVFDNGTELVTINEHGIFDVDLNKYVNISRENKDDYIGHRFISVDSCGNIGVKKLVAVNSRFVKDGYKYDIVTEGTLNYVAEDTLSVTHVLVDIINTFEFEDGTLLYDSKKMYEDINNYGLYTYDEWEQYADISVFEEYNIPVMNVGVEKGLYTKEYIIYLINTFVLDESVQII